MYTIKEYLDSLKPADRKALNYAFDHELEQYVTLPDGRYVGVHTATNKNLIPEMTAGAWSVGRLRNN